MDLALAAFVCATSIEALTHTAVLHSAEKLSDKTVKTLVDEATRLEVGYLNSPSSMSFLSPTAQEPHSRPLNRQRHFVFIASAAEPERGVSGLPKVRLLRDAKLGEVCADCIEHDTEVASGLDFIKLLARTRAVLHDGRGRITTRIDLDRIDGHSGSLDVSAGTGAAGG